MALSRLENFLQSIRGTVIHVNPDSLDSTDSISNTGTSATRPFKTIQRALIESARYSYRPGKDNDTFNETTIFLYPSTHYIDNRPGYLIDGTTSNYIKRGGGPTVPNGITGFTEQSNFDINSSSNELFKLNSVHGGVIVPRGTSIVGMDLRKTKVIPLFVPDPTNDNIEKSAVFRVTGGCYFWQFTIFDADPNGVAYKDYTTAQYTPNFSHHKLTVFEYADGVNSVEIDDDFLTFSSTYTDLDMYYKKMSVVYGDSSGRVIIPHYPSSGVDIETKIGEYQIVASRGEEVSITSIIAGDGVTATNVITVSYDREVEDLQVDTQIRINGVSVSGYNGQYIVSEVVNSTTIKYQSPTIPSTANGGSTGVLSIVVDSVTSASPYVFNCSLRSVYGMCGLHADGSKATGFKSMVVAQFTGIGLQKDNNAFVRYNSQTGTYEDLTVVTNLSSDSKSKYKPAYESTHIKASNDAFIQCVSIFSIGFSNHFLCESGGDMSITNSNSNFGAKSLVSRGFKNVAFNKDNLGYITHIVPPRIIQGSDTTTEFDPIDITKTLAVNNVNRLYLLGKTSADVAPESVLNGYRIGAKENDTLNCLISYNGVLSEYSANIIMSGGTTSKQKSHKVKKDSNAITNDIQNNIITLTENHTFLAGESIKVFSDDGQLPTGIETNTLYYVITQGLSANQIKLAATYNDYISNLPISIYSIETSNLTVISSVSDKISGEIGHPIQYDSTNGQWYITVQSGSSLRAIFNSISDANTSRTYIKRTTDSRSILDTLYRIRYVIPKDADILARAPEEGFIIQESSSSIAEQSELEKQFSFTTKNLSNSSELKNLRLIAEATYSSGTVTIRSELKHDLCVNDTVQIKNVKSTNNLTALDNLGYNGTFVVTKVINSITFEYTLASNPGTFTNVTEIRNNTLPYFIRKRYKDTYKIYRSIEVQKYIKDISDGVYNLLVVTCSNAPTVDPYNQYSFTQPIVDLYPQQDRDNPTSNFGASKSYAVSDDIGKVVINDLEKSITKESLFDWVSDSSIGIGITNIISNSVVGTSHTIYTSIDHGLNRIVTFTLTNAGSNYGRTAGVGGEFYNARLVGAANSTVGENATAYVSVNTSGVIQSIKLMSGGSGYGIGNTLSIVGIPTVAGWVPGYITVNSIYNNVNDVISINGITGQNVSDYNQLYRIKTISNGKSREFIADSVSTILSASTTGIGSTATASSFAVLTGKSVPVSSFTYTASTGKAVVSTSDAHGFQIGKVVRVSGSNVSLYNGNFEVSKVTGLTSLELNIGIGTYSPPSSGTLILNPTGFDANNGNTTSTDQNIGGRQHYIYAGITTITSAQIGVSDVNINIQNIANFDFKIGDYIQIDQEVMRISSNTIANPLPVLRGALATKQDVHVSGSVVRKISTKAVEFRRNSIIRASSHTFEYVGFGPGNYSTALPERQDRKLSDQEVLLAQSTMIDGGIAVFAAMNDRGDFYTGNRVVNSAQGKEEIYNTPIPTYKGESKDITNEVGLNILTPFEVTVDRSIRVKGGENSDIISQFDGPVILNNKVISNSDKGFEAKSIYIQGDLSVSRKYSVGIATPTTISGVGDVTYNGYPSPSSNIGWVYTTNNTWRKFGLIESQSGYYDGNFTGNFNGSFTGIFNFDSVAGITTFYDTTNSVDIDTGSVVVKGGVGIAKTVSIGGNANVTGKVGIGTTLAQEKLQVAGNTIVQGSVGINTNSISNSSLVGVGNSFNGLYISNGLIVTDNQLNGNFNIGTAFNAMIAGPVTINGSITVNGNFVVV